MRHLRLAIELNSREINNTTGTGTTAARRKAETAPI
jgi:hypothetical protein